MFGAALFNQRKEQPHPAIFGCVTTGEAWQFLKLADNQLTIDSKRYYIDQVETMLGVLMMTVNSGCADAD